MHAMAMTKVDSGHNSRALAREENRATARTTAANFIVSFFAYDVETQLQPTMNKALSGQEMQR